ncbi:MAG: alpha/beta fold hydrolase [Pseudomonadota bacterium]
MLRRSLAVLLTVIAVLAAGWLALRRGDIPYEVLEAAYASPQSRYMTLENGLKVHYRDQGSPDGPVLVMVHGFSSSLHTWEAWVDRLSDDYRLISIDLPGHGLSRVLADDPPSISAFVDTVDEATARLEAETFTLAGNSMGGATAWNFALVHPDRLDGLVLVAASGWPDEADDDDSPLIFRLLANPIARTVMKDLDMTTLVRNGLEDSYVDQSFVTDELVERYVALSRAPGHRDAILALSNARSERPVATAEALSTIEIPTLILQGAEDNLVPARHAQLFADAIPGAELKLYPNVGHLPQEEIADQTAADLTAFLERHAAAEGAPELVEAPAESEFETGAAPGGGRR